MRVIAGSMKGRKLKAPAGLSTRPLRGKVREALFNVLGTVADIRMLDLFAGTGAVGIEALSRGAESCVFVERGGLQTGLIADNLAGLVGKAEIIRGDARSTVKRFAETGRTFDLVFADPPYDMGLSQETTILLDESGIIVSGGLFALTVRAKEILPERAGTLATVFDRRYGDTRLVIYRQENDEDNSD